MILAQRGLDAAKPDAPSIATIPPFPQESWAKDNLRNLPYLPVGGGGPGLSAQRRLVYIELDSEK